MTGFMLAAKGGPVASITFIFRILNPSKNEYERSLLSNSIILHAVYFKLRFTLGYQDVG